ncbi:MAG TPA: alkaline phosphatase D family protein, partial [Bryobacteraceae bacterium]|nr:alkaline phosphatase D family protein [Bryobacteraceae bacterium]
MRRRDLLYTLAAPAFVRSETLRPQAAQGVAIGDVVPGRAIVWSRSDRPARMIVEYSTTESFANVKRVRGPHTIDASDFTARVDLSELPADQQVFCRVLFESLEDLKTTSEPVMARFRTPPLTRRNVKFVWSGDTVGQGWGINKDWGGMKGYEAMRRRNPDFFVHSGDTVYADGPVQSEVKLPDGTLWKNVTTEEKSKVAQSLTDFRGNYRYNLLDENVRRFQAEVPQVWQWDDHEVLNNWSPSKNLNLFPQYNEKHVGVLAGRATRAFLEYAPLRVSGDEAERVYRRIPYGPLLDVFVIDMRSYRGPNTHNRQPSESAETRYLGKPQLEWLAQGLAESRAVWKVIAADMPLGVQVPDGKDEQGRPLFENSANGNGPALGRELEIAWLLREIKRRKVRNTVWITADTHYTAAHLYTPAKAQFTDFDPFWEFISGPIHAGTFGPNELDNTFGPEVMFQKHPPKGQFNLPPSAGM